MTTEAEEFLVHYGVKGMKWGVRNDERGGYRLQTAGPIVDSNIHASTKAAGQKVAALMASRYGFQISSIQTIGPDHPEYQYGTVGFVKATPGKRGGDIFVRDHNLRKELKDAEDLGWFAKDCGHEHGLLTHESAHALFHAEQQVKNGFLGPKVTGGNIKARDRALDASSKVAERAGISPFQFLSKVSGYAEASGTREEMEAELFSQYHWSPNPPPFVKVWGETLHREMGIDSTPFREEVRDRA